MQIRNGSLIPVNANEIEPTMRSFGMKNNQPQISFIGNKFAGMNNASLGMGDSFWSGNYLLKKKVEPGQLRPGGVMA